eukprot:Nk52_evm2s179 gene=Nk52_evmTU2s179
MISHKYMVHGTLIEIIWTIMPAVVLMAIAFPSFKLLYLMDEIIDPDYVDENSSTLTFDSYMVPVEDLELRDIRLLEVDNEVVVPVETCVRVVVTASDVSGVYYRACSEICGTGHGYMPIVVKAVPMNSYLD